MDPQVRESGITPVGAIPWGSHFCQFYRTTADLAEILVPYFEAGLRNNESCLWVTSQSLEADAAEDAMVQALPDFKRYLSSGQMQIVSITDWYKPGAAFDADEVLAAWVQKEADSRAKGFAGLRLTGDTIWVERSGWNDFMEYEAKVNGTFRRYNMVALCTYCMDRCTAEDVIDVCRHHQFALARRHGDWELLESASLKLAKEHLNALNRELEEKVDARTRELNTALRARDEFLAMLGHELRNPLAPIRHATETIRARSPDDPIIRASTAILERQVSHVTRLVDDLLDVGRITQGRINLERETLPLVEVLEHAIELNRPLIDQRGHSLKLSLPSRNVKVDADRTRLAQVFGNLLHNAAKYTPDGGTVALEATVSGEEATVCVRDTGPGIPPEMLDSIFDLFTQAPRTLARSDGGLGIGLTLVRKVAQMHGGTVSAFNGPDGEGACFVVRLPLCAASAQESPRHGAAPGVGGARRRILVVDDNVDGNRSLAMLLDLVGHEVVSAFDGPSALEVAREFRPEVVLLDIGLPGLDGYEVARRLRAHGLHDTYLVAVTGYGRQQDVERSSAAGFDQHLLKPVVLEQVSALLDRIPAKGSGLPH